MLEVGGGHEFVFVANRVLGNIDAVRDDFGLPEGSPELHVFESLRHTESSDLANEWRRKASEIVRRSFLAGLGVDAVHTTSLFEGYGDDTCASITRGNGAYLEAVTLYDLIPYTFPSVYLANPGIRNWYYERLGHMRRADLLLAISEFSAGEACVRLGLRRENVFNISGAADAHFRPLTLNEDRRDELLAKYGLRRFIMYTGGIDHRKNIERLIEAYARLPAGLVATLQLAIVCKVHPQEKQRLGELARSLGLNEDRLVLTDFIPDDDLVALYNTCDLFVFPSWCEGFGLPALEAMQCGAPVIAADASSLPEVVGRKDALFNPLDVDSIAAKMGQALEDHAFRDDLRLHGVQRASGFTWNESARRALEAMEESHDRRTNLATGRSQVLFGQHIRPKLAFVSPLPPDKSGIAAYSAELLPFLEEYYQITLIQPDGETDDPYLHANMPIHDADWFRKNVDRFDRVIYQFGNSSFHAHMFELLEEIPGSVVLHDFWLSGVVAYLQSTGRMPGFWDEELYYSHGWPALADRSTKDDEVVRNAYPANRRVLDLATGVIVHSTRTVEMIQDWYGEALACKTVHVPILRTIPAPIGMSIAKERLGYDAETRLLCTFGFLDATKYSLEIAKAFLASSLAKDPQIKLVMVGANPETVYGESISAIIAGSDGRIIVTGFVDQEEYSLYLQAAEAAVQLRRGTRGETSAAALDCLANRTALLINRNPAFSGIPDESALVLDEDFEAKALVIALDRLMNASGDRETRIAVGIDYLRDNCSPTKIARQYSEAIESFEHASPRLRAALACKEMLGVDAGVPAHEADLCAAADAVRANTAMENQVGVLYVDADLGDQVDLHALLQHDETPCGTRLVPRIELICNDGVGFFCNREKMSSLLGLKIPMADTRLSSQDNATYLLDLGAVLRRAGSMDALTTILGQGVGGRKGRLWFYCSAVTVQTVALPLLVLASRFAEGFVVDSGNELDEMLRLALSVAERERMRLVHLNGLDATLTDAVLALPAMSGQCQAESLPVSVRTIQRQAADKVWMAGPEGLSSQVGEWCEGHLRSNGTAGFLVFGPYAAVGSGRYVLRIHGHVQDNGSTRQAWYDVTSERGQRKLVESTPLQPVAVGLLVEHELALDSPIDDMEVRLWVGADESLEFRALQLTKL